MEELYSAAAPKIAAKVEAQLRRANEGLEAAKRRASQGKLAAFGTAASPMKSAGCTGFKPAGPMGGLRAGGC